MTSFANLEASIRPIKQLRRKGSVIGNSGNLLSIKGLPKSSKVGDFVSIISDDHTELGEIVDLSKEGARVLPQSGSEGCAVGDDVEYIGTMKLSPDRSWLGRTIDALGRPLDGQPLLNGVTSLSIKPTVPDAALRKSLGQRIEAGLAAFNTFLPLVQGQRVGLFSGSGVGKSTLLGELCRYLDADVVVIAMVGERGREVGEFIRTNLDQESLKRSVVVTATSDQSALLRRRAAMTAMTVAEYFRDLGLHVLFLCDSLTRFAEAHREVALARGEVLDQTGFPVSTSHEIMHLCERAGPGARGTGDITAVFSVLVPGSDLDGPIADLVRGVLDGHVVLAREIAERGRFPAIDILKSVSRSLPAAASHPENEILSNARKSMAAYQDIQMLLQTGLYSAGIDPEIDKAIEQWPRFEAFLTQKYVSSSESFEALAECLSLTSQKRDAQIDGMPKFQTGWSELSGK